MKQQSPPAPALARGIQLIEQLAVDGQATLEKLSAKNGWPKSSVLRCLQTLEQLKVVVQDQETLHWRTLQRLQPCDLPTLAPLERARKKLPLLAQQTDECTELYRYHEGQLQLIDRAEPDTGEMMVVARIGYQRKLDELDATALMVYAFDPHSVPPAKGWIWKKGKHKILSPEKRTQRIAAAQKKFFASDDHFNESGIRRFAIPVMHAQTLLGVLAVAQRQTPRADTQSDAIIQTLLTHQPI
ncbi:helix-turn-helix domain-containing protein [Kiritimatiellota bacterium B12222]|nr:helix-turn-helix domain-containing protein [Kiritimatiellota bacterium B12222]